MPTLQKLVEHNGAKQEEIKKRKLAVFAFGRFNPPTKGHGLIVDKVAEIAHQLGGDGFIFTSKTHDKDKNPLDYDTKIVFMRRVYQKVYVVHDRKDKGITKDIKNVFNAVGYLGAQEYTDLVFVVGSDRVEEFTKRFNRSGDFFDSFSIVNAGNRDPDASNVSGMSGTKARKAAMDNDMEAFQAATGWEGEVASELIAAVQEGMRND